MTAQDIVSDILLGLAVLIVAGASIGVLLMRDAYQKLHFVTPAALVAPTLVALAVLAQVGVYENAGETFLALLFLVIAGPFLSHATIRAIRVREKGDWRPDEGGNGPGGKKGRATEEKEQ
jgi:multisubunit Na+/H+ antiporter MnhG subunit